MAELNLDAVWKRGVNDARKGLEKDDPMGLQLAEIAGYEWRRDPTSLESHTVNIALWAVYHNGYDNADTEVDVS